jgi:serine/threonine protein kinase
MVITPKYLVKANLVLFSKKDQCWKLADFGSAAAATSKKLVTTALSRGTEGYRAPEVLTRGRYSKRSDMFALGCITYEIVTGQKLFSSDWAVLEYLQTDIPLYPTRWPPCSPGTRLLQLGEVTSKLVTVDHTARFGTKATARQLRFIRRGSELDIEDPASHTEDSDVESDPTETVSNPILQPSLRSSSNPRKRQLSTDYGKSLKKRAVSRDEEIRKNEIMNMRHRIQKVLLDPSGKEAEQHVYCIDFSVSNVIGDP